MMRWSSGRIVAGIGALAVLAALATAAARPTLAQRGPMPEQRAPAPGKTPSHRPNTAGEFDYYSLVLSWSPSFCASLPRDRYDPQCHRRDGKRYSFVLHGLWPQYERSWPQDCPSPDRGFVPRDVANRMLDIMPSEKLVFHQYRKHGTCTGLGPQGYFDLSRHLHDKVKIPPRYTPLTEDRLFIGVEELIKEFLTVNPKLRPDMLAVDCGGPGPRLKEIRFCFDKAGEHRACGRNEDQKRLCSAARIFIPPVRPGAGAAPRAGGPAAKEPLPGPKEPLPGPKAPTGQRSL